MLLDALQIFRATVALFHGPARTAGEHRVHFGGRQMDCACAAQSGRDVRVERVCQKPFDRLDPIDVEARQQCSHATGNVESDPSSGYHTISVRVEGGDPTDRKTVTPVCVRHGERRFYNARQGCNVGDLFGDLVIHVQKQPLVCVDKTGNAHGAALGHFPLVV